MSIAEALAALVLLYVQGDRAEPSAQPSRTAERVVQTGPTAAQWQDLRECESGNDYSINTGNGYYGAYQFDVTTWQGVGGTGLPSDASPAEQDMRAQRLYQLRGAQPWPVCGKYLG